MDQAILDTEPITDACTYVEAFFISGVVGAAAADLRTANTELKTLPSLITGLGVGMFVTKKGLEYINKQMGGLLYTVNVIYTELSETRTVSSFGIDLGTVRVMQTATLDRAVNLFLVFYSFEQV